jgi:predicted small lipoprotein YifL
MRDRLCLLVLMVSLSACGIKGPLYIPEQRYPQKSVPATPATDASKTEPSATQPANTTTETK